MKQTETSTSPRHPACRWTAYKSVEGTPSLCSTILYFLIVWRAGRRAVCEAVHTAAVMRRSPLADGRATRHGPAARVHGAYFTIETGYPVTISYYIKALRNRKCLKKTRDHGAHKAWTLGATCARRCVFSIENREENMQGAQMTATSTARRAPRR